MEQVFISRKYLEIGNVGHNINRYIIPTYMIACNKECHNS